MQFERFEEFQESEESQHFEKIAHFQPSKGNLSSSEVRELQASRASNQSIPLIDGPQVNYEQL